MPQPQTRKEYHCTWSGLILHQILWNSADKSFGARSDRNGVDSECMRSIGIPIKPSLDPSLDGTRLLAACVTPILTDFCISPKGVWLAGWRPTFGQGGLML